MPGLHLPAYSYDRTSMRPSWEQLPPTLHAALADRLGSPAASARVTGTGFTPGFAAVLTTEDGQAHFVKAAPLGTPVADWYGQEALFTASLPKGVPAPALRWCDELSGYLVLCFEAIEGARAPVLPWPPEELNAALEALAKAASAIAENPAELHALGPTPWSEVVDDVLRNWRSGKLDHPHSEELAALEGRFEELTKDASGLFHCDLRLDNVIIGASGAAWICDWNWLAYGPPFFDLLTLLLTAEGSGLDTDALFFAHPLAANVTGELLDAGLAAIGGFYVTAAARPEIENSPWIRAHQRYYSELTLRWLSRRRGWSP
jgi:aminoglycoside phosphotransferase (APT) family kinase protein